MFIILSHTPDPWDGAQSNDGHNRDQTDPCWHCPTGDEAEQPRLGREEPLGVG